ncbi:MAG: diguanylate cyclase [Thermodesulfobacteriota bacterium]
MPNNNDQLAVGSFNGVAATLSQSLDDFDGLEAKLEKLAAQHGSGVYAVLLGLVCDQTIPAQDAKNVWTLISHHHRFMCSRLGRSVSLQTVICDYFSVVSGSSRNMKLVDQSRYERTIALSRTDYLTGLYNRRVFAELFEREVSMTTRHGTDLSLLFFDIDDFRHVNERYGHAGGDAVLRAIAGVFLSSRRQEDIVSRYGGEEIVVLLPHTGKQQGLALGERIRGQVEKLAVAYNGFSIRVSISGGLASYPFDCAGPETLLRDADQAMYRAKAAGKNRICLFSPCKRRHTRVDCDFEMLLLLPGRGRGCDDSIARCRNLSGGGALFESDRSFEPGALLETRLIIGPDAYLPLTGRVVHCRPETGGGYSTAMSFFEPDRRGSLALSSLILRQTCQAAAEPAAAPRFC